MHDGLPLIVTLQLDEHAFTFFNALRKAHFPPERNFLSAHLTLFHHLPSGETSIHEDLRQWSSRQSLLDLQVTEVKSTGKGVAYKMESPALLQLHRQMQERWKAWLSPQDRQKLLPHVTVQNKVPAEKARETFDQLKESFQPFTAKGIGFGLWVYEGGPWRFMDTFAFCRESAILP